MIAALFVALVQCPDGSPPPCAGAVIASGPRAGSVAVLYFAARDSADAYLADGLTEDLTTLLARDGALVVKPSSSVRLAQRRQPTAAAQSLGRSLNVRYVVQGSLRRAGDRVRLNVELIAAGADRSVWGQSYDRSPEQLLDLPGELAEEVARRVSAGGQGFAAGPPRGPAPGPQASPAPMVPQSPAPARATREAVWETRNPAALDHFRRGNWLMATRVREAEAYREFQEAARLDPNFASAIARSAYTLALMWNRSALEFSTGDTVSMRARGLELAAQALRVDSSNSDAWMALGYLRALSDLRTLAGAEDAFRRAVTLDSMNAEAWHQYGQILGFLGDDAGAVIVLERALQIEPARAISLADLAFTLLGSLRDTVRAFTLIDSAIAVNAEHVFAYFTRGMLHVQFGRFDAALRDAASITTRDSANPLGRVLRTTALARLRRTAEARVAARPWLRPNADGSLAGAATMLALGDTAWALEHLERTPASMRDAALWMLLRLPVFDPLRANPRFQRVYRDSRPLGARSP